MRGSIAASPKSVEARHRLSASIEDPNKRRLLKNKDFKDIEKVLYNPHQDRSFNCRLSIRKIVLVVIIVGTFLTLFHSPAVNNTDRLSNYGS
ncbi:hypothetical protein Dimus_005445, partial [Dionaea muscipula]